MLVCGAAVWGQQISGTISGIVKDAQQGAVVNAAATLTDQAQGGVRATKTGTDGAFVFTDL